MIGDLNCTIDALIEDPGSCSDPFCELTDAGLTDLHCEDNNETGNQDDDFIWFQLNPIGLSLQRMARRNSEFGAGERALEWQHASR